MSGGSYDYAFCKVDDMADNLITQADPVRVAFGRHLKLVAKAMHDIEWVDSCDFSSGDELDAIQNVLGASNVKHLVLNELTKQAEELIVKLECAIKEAKKK